MGRSQRGIIVGALLGAALGAALAWTVLGEAKENEPLTIKKASPSDWFKAGSAILTAARQISDIVEQMR